ncbi:MAG: hypothetical protein RLZZ324_1097, partial [Candidatus Parcubacteria bacterium]
MTRIEAPVPQQSVDAGSIRKIVRHELFFDVMRRKAIGCGGCLIAFLIVLAVPTTWAAVTAAKSGFFSVPLLTRWLYEPSVPTRIVTPYIGTTAQ